MVGETFMHLMVKLYIKGLQCIYAVMDLVKTANHLLRAKNLISLTICLKTTLRFSDTSFCTQFVEIARW